MSRAVLQFLILLIVAAVLACWIAGPANAQDQQGQTAPNSRVALVIGNSRYQHAAPIETATKDAAAMAASLTRLGFAVSSLSDADYDKTRRALLAFAQSARQASMATIYFAGYGIQAKGENYLVPVEANLQSDIEIGATSLHALMSAVSGAKELGLIILEAGRGNPFASEISSSSHTRSIEPGLATVEPGEDNVLVAFAARPGTTAVDRGGPHSVFTEALLNNIETPGLEIQYLFRNVEADVREATDQEQEAVHYGSLSEKEIFLKPAELATNSVELAGKGEPASTVMDSEEIAWFFLRETTDVPSLRQFMERFPNGQHHAEANALVARLEQPAQAPAPAPPPSVDEIAWSILSERPTAGGLQRFLEAYGDSPHAHDALALLTNIAQHQQDAQSRQAQKPQLDNQPAVSPPLKKRPIVRRISRNDSNVEVAWQLVRTSRDPVVLRKFAAEFPSRQYVSATGARLTELGLDHRRPTNLSPTEAAEYSVEQCDRLAGGELTRVSRDAVDACRRALAAHPDLARLRFQLCQCLIEDGRHREAAEQCRVAAQMADARGDQESANRYRLTQTALLITDGGPSTSKTAGDTGSVNGGAPSGGAALNNPHSTGVEMDLLIGKINSVERNLLTLLASKNLLTSNKINSVEMNLLTSKNLLTSNKINSVEMTLLASKNLLTSNKINSVEMNLLTSKKANSGATSSANAAVNSGATSGGNGGANSGATSGGNGGANSGATSGGAGLNKRFERLEERIVPTSSNAAQTGNSNTPKDLHFRDSGHGRTPMSIKVHHITVSPSSVQAKVATPTVRARVNTPTVTANVPTVNTPTTRVPITTVPTTRVPITTVPTTRVPTIRVPTVPTVRIH